MPLYGVRFSDSLTKVGDTSLSGELSSMCSQGYTLILPFILVEEE